MMLHIKFDCHQPAGLRDIHVGRAPSYKLTLWAFGSGELKMKMALSLELSGILWWNFANTFILTWYSPWGSQMTFGIDRGFAEVQILKTVKFNFKTFWNIWKNFADTLILTRSSSRNWKMTFIISRGFAECQILKKWKWVQYFDKLLRKHWYWQVLAQEIAKWHFSLVEALPSSKFWKSDNGAISWTEWNIVMKFCIDIDIDKM